MSITNRQRCEGSPDDSGRPPRPTWRRVGVVAGVLAGVGLSAVAWDLARHRHAEAPLQPGNLLRALNRYRFRTVWSVAAQPAEAFQAVEHVENYPLWWPEVKHVSLSGKLRPQTVIRGFLPYSLHLAMKQVHVDRRHGIIEARLAGDLHGRSRWTVSAASGGSDLVFEEDVELGKAWMRVLGPPFRPLLRANHAVMMRHGQKGLAAYLDRGGAAEPSPVVATKPVTGLIAGMASIYDVQGEVGQRR